jgi:hypothetical protein
MIQRCGAPEQLAEYRRQEELCKTPERKARQWMGSQIFPFSHTGEDGAGWRLCRRETDMEKRAYRAWYLIANPRKLLKEIVDQELEFRFKLFPEKKENIK